ncbi:MAG TPA: permease [Methanomassiliicoccales archaeon]|nr:permease [Methanomassiliicoccales archaeon]
MLFGALQSGVDGLIEYVSQHTLTCLIPAFFIAGAIAAFVKKEAILKYFGPQTKKYISYPVASVSGLVLAVCSCTILPLFTGIYKKGSGLGPAITFLFAGPGINVLAIIYTAQVLGYDLGLARAVAAVGMSVLVGLIMSTLFRSERPKGEFKLLSSGDDKPKWVILGLFLLLTLILVIGASQLDWLVKLPIIYALTLVVAYLAIYHFERDEITDWGMETWDLAKKIVPILLIGTFAVGVLAYFLPPETFAPYLGNNSLSANLISSLLGAILYMPTLLEVPIIGTTFGYTTGAMAAGPALALLLAGPTISAPSLVVLARVMGVKKTLTYALLVVIMSTIAGMIFGSLVG